VGSRELDSCLTDKDVVVQELAFVGVGYLNQNNFTSISSDYGKEKTKFK
jgi:hypothetical protein